MNNFKFYEIQTEITNYNLEFINYSVINKKIISSIILSTNYFISHYGGVPSIIIGNDMLDYIVESPALLYCDNFKNYKNTSIVGKLMNINIYLCHKLNNFNNKEKNIIITNFDIDETIKQAFIVEDRKEKLKKLN